jgi:hypothetical protein
MCAPARLPDEIANKAGRAERDAARRASCQRRQPDVVEHVRFDTTKRACAPVSSQPVSASELRPGRKDA